MAKAKKTQKRRGGAKKVKRTLSKGQVHILASFNNTIVTVTDLQGTFGIRTSS